LLEMVCIHYGIHNQFEKQHVLTCLSWSYGSWIYNYLCNQCLSPLTLWVWTPLRRGVLNTTFCNKVCQWLAAGQWFSLGTLVSVTYKTDHHDITEILLKVALKHHYPNPQLALVVSYCKQDYLSISTCSTCILLPTRLYIYLNLFYLYSVANKIIYLSQLVLLVFCCRQDYISISTCSGCILLQTRLSHESIWSDTPNNRIITIANY
jgi:hypothetical protein